MGIEGCIDAEEMRFLWALALQALEGLWFVELGAYKGRSLSILAAVAPSRKARCMALDTFHYHRGGSLAEVQANLERLGLEATVLESDSRAVPEAVQPGSVGVLHVDTKHTAEHLTQELGAWRPALHSQAIVACHDYGRDVHPEVQPAVDAWFAGWERLGLVGTLIAHRRVG